MEYGDALKAGKRGKELCASQSCQDVHSEMIAAGADSDTADWRIVEARQRPWLEPGVPDAESQAFIREASSCVSRWAADVLIAHPFLVRMR